ncbi:hypothetical protein P3339_01740 [Microbulbifer sp. MLAF003]|uniref:hypothetical protein n=1 Tax=unclassified Microbulbifer TaxID=2619833 RepID=UPI0024AD8E55|nr:hypothetical protein [Microbulbifer sp. MLAF003]WHI51579.1 hypothetical protein P3339_01740 [Microbulbifer sp. MLAF003]
MEQTALLQKAEGNRKALDQLNKVRQQNINKYVIRQQQGKNKRKPQSMSLMDAQKDRAEKGPGKLKRNLEQRQLLLEANRDGIKNIYN